ncbi:MAG: hypothetical protein A3J97_16275 [Spirochaetes bacterium RIFOXYC1_FULL_54_7]|nr:MAG: hypothetical protein A3J97_16275 [Spirochaetes bacterium RIFOXYC1_FULL_54_7]
MVSLSSIARHVGVSKSTVSLVLNNKPNVSTAMKEKVLRAIAELEPQSINGRSVSTKNPSILLIHPLSMSSHQVFRELLQGIKSAVVDEAHGNLTLAAHDPPLKPNHATSALIHDPSLRPDGVILMGALEDDPIFGDIRAEKLPCVLLARQHGPEGISVVGMDNNAGARLAVEFLLSQGHRRIAFVGGDRVYDYTELRQQGYKDRMELEGLEAQVYLGKGDEAIAELLSDTSGTNRMPTAILFVNDEHAVDGIKKLRVAGLQVPQDLSAIGFDDSENATECVPPLTSVRVPRFLIGKLAGRTVIDHLNLPDIDHENIVLKTTLTLRDSVRSLI